MHTIKLNNNIEVQLYNNAESLPARRYYVFLYYFALACNISMDNLGSYFNSLNNLIADSNTKEALVQTRNMQISMFNALKKIGLKSMCWAQLIHNINGELIVDYSDENLQKKVDYLMDNGLRFEQIWPIVEEVKKKFFPSLNPEDY